MQTFNKAEALRRMNEVPMGSFQRAIADALLAADAKNEHRLLAAFPEIILGQAQPEIYPEAKAFAVGQFLSKNGVFDDPIALYEAMEASDEFDFTGDTHGIVVWEPFENEENSWLQEEIVKTAVSASQLIREAKGLVATEYSPH